MRTMSSQKSLRQTVEIEGVGLHSGAETRVRLHPAPADSGIVFERADLGGRRIVASAANVRSTSLATTLAEGDASVGTVEHLMAALAGMGIDNARIEVEGPEIPILDGSAAPFVDAIRRAGTVLQAAPRRDLSLRRPVTLRQGERTILALPSDDLRISYAIDFSHPAIGYQAVTLRMDESVFAASIAPARTFCLLRDVRAMRDSGLVRGGSLDNALVVGDDGVMNGQLRFRDEFVRHKVLDLVGDLALLGRPLLGHVIARNAGHALNYELVLAIQRAV
ncbi:MAG TPA: UDP-3-O-acyl-N-acetylglucosamine deacetylase, partial [Candidatus Polarisedimenticolia bacterium]|nr:UDP-3-O-acyl-N-acetylglucosamine deacetylase [Candidatus Polarisedimenticolia bacterium]